MGCKIGCQLHLPAYQLICNHRSLHNSSYKLRQVSTDFKIVSKVCETSVTQESGDNYFGHMVVFSKFWCHQNYSLGYCYSERSG